MLLVAVVICTVGILQIYSATHETKWANAWWKQIIYVCAGLLLMWMICTVDYHTLLGQVPVFYGISLFLLALVWMIGTSHFGARRWIALPGNFHFQVSEFVKLVIILLVARYLTNLKKECLEGKDLFKLGGLIAFPLLFVVVFQRDLGTSLTYIPVFAIGLFLAGLQLRHILILALLAVAVPAVSYNFLLDHQKARVDTFLDPDADPQGRGYQVVQSKIAVGAGKMWGQGVTQGSQTRLRFLPVPHSDFIFATFSEEHGFVGVVFILALYFWLLLKIVQNAQAAPDRPGMYICMGVASLLLFHLLVNVGMVVGLMPVTGIPLPLMSAGGSSMLSMFLMLGLVNNVRLRRFIN